MDDVRGWLAPEIGQGPIELTIVGDFDPEAAIGFVARTFGALPARGPKPAYAEQRKVSFPAAGFTAERKVPTEIERGTVFVFWPTTDARDVKISRRLNVLADVISDRLRVKIREGLGGAYSPGVGNIGSDTFTGYGFTLVQIGVEPAQAPTILAAVKEIAEALRTGGVTDDELQRAKQPLLTQIVESARTNGYWAYAVLLNSREFPERLDWARTRTADTEAIAKAEVDALAARYLLPDRMVGYIVLPEPMPAATPPPATE